MSILEKIIRKIFASYFKDTARCAYNNGWDAKVKEHRHINFVEMQSKYPIGSKIICVYNEPDIDYDVYTVAGHDEHHNRPTVIDNGCLVVASGSIRKHYDWLEGIVKSLTWDQRWNLFAVNCELHEDDIIRKNSEYYRKNNK